MSTQNSNLFIPSMKLVFSKKVLDCFLDFYKNIFENIKLCHFFADCFPGPEFLCENHRCIPFFLQCDGFDHCGDGSDENERCAINERKENTQKFEFFQKRTKLPIYFFPFSKQKLKPNRKNIG